LLTCCHELSRLTSMTFRPACVHAPLAKNRASTYAISPPAKMSRLPTKTDEIIYTSTQHKPTVQRRSRAYNGRSENCTSVRPFSELRQDGRGQRSAFRRIRGVWRGITAGSFVLQIGSAGDDGDEDGEVRGARTAASTLEWVMPSIGPATGLLASCLVWRSTAASEFIRASPSEEDPS